MSETIPGTITEQFLKNSNELFESDPKNVLARNALTSTSWGTILINRDEIQKINHVFSKKLPDMKITNQKASGRCWLFATLNLMRRQMVKKYKLPDDFELSQPYLFFWDKFEKCNYFLEQIIDTADEPVEGRLLQHLLTDPTNDGGQWDMLVNIVNKYGVIPKSVYPESEATGRSYPLNKFLKSKLREFAKVLRNMHQSGKSNEQLRVEKEQMMQIIHRIMIIHLGSPPTTFDWQFQNKDKKYQCYLNLTPKQFYKEFIPVDVNNLISIVNDPRNPYDHSMTVDRLGNVIGGKNVLYINASIDDLWKYAKISLDHDEPVWFGCDVGKDSSMKKNGIMSKTIFQYDLVFGTTLQMPKKERLRYHESEMTHAMLFTGYDVPEQTKEDLEEKETKETSEKTKEEQVINTNLNIKPTKWRVENSWGDEAGDKGFDLMTDAWFDEHMYQVVIDKKYLRPEHLAVLEQEPIHLPPWDPMGSLA